MTSKSNPNFDEHRWVIKIRKALDEELKEDTNIPVSIFNVPKTLSYNNPDLYVPQQVALGPYHYWRPELYEMERYKVSAAKRAQNNFQKVKFHHLVDQFMEMESKIRSCYHKYLDFSGETLAWMMAIDASFLLEFIQVYAKTERKTLTGVSSRMSHLVDVFGRKSAHNTILRDLIMLENQIPLITLRQMLECQYSSLDLVDEMLISMLVGLCKELSPFKMIEEGPNIKVIEISHLLDFLYHIIVSKSEEKIPDITEAKERGDEALEIKERANSITKILLKLSRSVVRVSKKVIVSKPIRFALKLPLIIMSFIPGLKLLKVPLEYILFSEDKGKEMIENENSSLENNILKPPLVEEITIPSVTELANAGVQFVATNGGIENVKFEVNSAKFYLPILSIDVNSEVVMRNLVAYEACNGSGPLIFTRFTELMNGIIDTEEDATLLRGKGIILNRMKSDQEVADLWNGMSKSVRLAKVPSIDKVIEDANVYYNGKWKIKFRKFVNIYFYGSWRFLTLVAAILLLLLMSLQAFCTVYGCIRLLHRSRT